MAQGGRVRRRLGGLEPRGAPDHGVIRGRANGSAQAPTRWDHAKMTAVGTRHCRNAAHIVRGASTVACRPKRQFAAGPVAQWLEPAAHNGLVAGSSPAGPTSLCMYGPESLWKRVTLERGRTATVRCRRQDPSVRSSPYSRSRLAKSARPEPSTRAGRGDRKRRARARVSQAPE